MGNNKKTNKAFSDETTEFRVLKKSLFSQALFLYLRNDFLPAD